MATSDRKRKSKQKWHQSSGASRLRRARRALARTELKIARWKRYAQEIQEGKRLPNLENPTRWNTNGLESHCKNLGDIIKRGKMSW